MARARHLAGPHQPPEHQSGWKGEVVTPSSTPVLRGSTKAALAAQGHIPLIWKKHIRGSNQHIFGKALTEAIGRSGEKGGGLGSGLTTPSSMSARSPGNHWPSPVPPRCF